MNTAHFVFAGMDVVVLYCVDYVILFGADKQVIDNLYHKLSK